MSRAWLLIFLVVGSAMSQSEILVQEDQWDVADLATVRLEPHTFPVLPATVQTDLVLRGCTIPQPWLADTPENVIRGNFLASGENAWAVLCSRQLRSSVLVYVEGFEAAVELNLRADREFPLTALQFAFSLFRGTAACLKWLARTMVTDHDAPVAPLVRLSWRHSRGFLRST